MSVPAQSTPCGTTTIPIPAGTAASMPTTENNNPILGSPSLGELRRKFALTSAQEESFAETVASWDRDTLNAFATEALTALMAYEMAQSGSSETEMFLDQSGRSGVFAASSLNASQRSSFMANGSGTTIPHAPRSPRGINTPGRPPLRAECSAKDRLSPMVDDETQTDLHGDAFITLCPPSLQNTPSCSSDRNKPLSVSSISISPSPPELPLPSTSTIQPSTTALGDNKDSRKAPPLLPLGAKKDGQRRESVEVEVEVALKTISPSSSRERVDCLTSSSAGKGTPLMGVEDVGTASLSSLSSSAMTGSAHRGSLQRLQLDFVPPSPQNASCLTAADVPLDAAGSLRSYMASMKMNAKAVRQMELGFLTVNNYICFEQIGRGTNSVVFHGQELSDDNEVLRDVVVKVIPRDLVAGRKKGFTNMGATPAPSPAIPSLRVSPVPCGAQVADPATPMVPSSLHHEIAVMKKVKHENVMRVIEAIDDATHQYVYLVMPYAEEGPILKRATENTYHRIPEATALKHMKQITKGLYYLHNQDIVHHDIKPDNILMGKEDHIYISDFGVADILAQNDESHSDEPGTNHYRFVGTPAFHAPEVYSCSSDAGIDTKKLDMWALGITFYMMITGVLPFSKDPSIPEDEQMPNALDPARMDFFPRFAKRIQEEDIVFPDYYIRKGIATPVSQGLLQDLVQRIVPDRITAHKLARHRCFRSAATRVLNAIDDCRETNTISAPAGAQPTTQPGGNKEPFSLEPAVTTQFQPSEGDLLLSPHALNTSGGSNDGAELSNASFSILSPRNVLDPSAIVTVTEEEAQAAFTQASFIPKNYSHSHLFSPGHSPMTGSLSPGNSYLPFGSSLTMLPPSSKLEQKQSMTVLGSGSATGSKVPASVPRADSLTSLDGA